MDTSKTQFYKARDGWNAKDVIDIGMPVEHSRSGDAGVRMLTIHTYKSSRGGIHTYASCAIHGGGMITMDVFGDFSKRVTQIGSKCTERAVKELHAAVMSGKADEILAEARAFYEAKDAAKALHAKQDAELKRQDA